jgi:hypothetical protein
MKRIVHVLFIVVLLTGCFFNKTKKEAFQDKTNQEETLSDYLIGVYFLNNSEISEMINDFESRTEGKLVYYKPENYYYVFSYKDKTDAEIDGIINKINEIEYVSESERDSELNVFFPSNNHIVDNSEQNEEELGAWELPIER